MGGDVDLTVRTFVGRHRLACGAVAVGGLAVVAWLAFGWFGVQGLWVDDEVDEAAPVFASGATTEPPAPSSPDPAGDTPTTTAPPQPTIVNLGTGRFISRSHTTEGVVTVLGDGSPQRFLRLTEFATDNGPDVDVYLSTAAPDADEQTLDDDVVVLGDLKGNVGDQNYEIPAGVDLGRYRTVVLWCVRFSVAFGAAPLDPPT